MMKLFLLWALLLLPVGPAAAQEIKMSQTAPLEQVYGETVEDDALLPMNELDMDFGYALYETTVDVEEENPTLTIENVRDYAVVYADGKLQGYLKDSSKSRSERAAFFCPFLPSPQRGELGVELFINALAEPRLAAGFDRSLRCEPADAAVLVRLDGQRVAVVRDEKIGHIQVQMRGNVCAPLLMSVHGQDLE